MLMSDLWRRCLERLEGDFSVEEMHTYLKPLQPVEDAEGLRLLAPNEYTLDFVRAEFLPRINAVLQHLQGAPVKLRLEVGTLNNRRVVRTHVAVTAPGQRTNGGWTRSECRFPRSALYVRDIRRGQV